MVLFLYIVLQLFLILMHIPHIFYKKLRKKMVFSVYSTVQYWHLHKCLHAGHL